MCAEVAHCSRACRQGPQLLMASSGALSDHTEGSEAGLGWRGNQKPSLVLVLRLLLPTCSRRGITLQGSRLHHRLLLKFTPVSSLNLNNPLVFQ